MTLMSLRECLSIMELQEVKERGPHGRVVAHLEDCARCRALLRDMPDVSENDLPLSSMHLVDTMQTAPTPSPRSGPRPASGEVWRAAASRESAWSQLVAVVGRSRAEPGLVIAIPISEEVEYGTDLDLPVARDVLGYNAMLLAWNHGAVLEGQLLEQVGTLSEAAREELVGFYRWLVAGGVRPQVRTVGPPLAGPEDERSWFRSEELESFLLLREPASQEPGGEVIETPADDTEQDEAIAAARSRTVVPFSDFLRRRLASDEWDENSLLERTGIDRRELDGFLSDKLELTSASDARALALILRELGSPPEEVEPQIRRSLELSPGGVVMPESGWRRVAARARSHVPGQQRERDLFGGAELDESEAARGRAIDLYWNRLLECYEMLTP
jgi:hypothetical protein